MVASREPSSQSPPLLSSLRSSHHILVCHIASIIYPAVLDEPKWPATFPFQPQDFARYDESPDTDFYATPRFVTHIDDPAINALTKWYASNLPASGGKDVAVLGEQCRMA